MVVMDMTVPKWHVSNIDDLQEKRIVSFTLQTFHMVIILKMVNQAASNIG
jgi:hypothetical protein